MTSTTAVQAPPESPPSEATYRDKLGIPFQVRAYQPSDRKALHFFYEAFEPKRSAQGLPPAAPERIAVWLNSVLASGIHLLAFRDGKLIGHGLVMPTNRPGIGEYAVFLRQDLRGRGMGTALNRAVVDAARAAGLRGLWLTVEGRNKAAVRSYEKVGFRARPFAMFSFEAEMELTFG
jgi:RimJ/RimL family protein N-acetyltransferase